MTDVATSGFGSMFGGYASKPFGSQATWAIDPIAGDDSAVGDTAAPLRTMAEFNRRWAGLESRVAATCSVIGSAGVIDEALMIMGARFVGGTLTLVGTPISVGTGTITVVTNLASAATWQLTTTGIVWASGDVGKRIALSTGHVCWVQEFVDANNVVVGPVTNTTTTITPTLTTFTLQTLPPLLMPSVGSLSAVFTASINIQNFEISAGGLQVAGAVLNFFGCKLLGTTNNWQANIITSMRGCYTAITGAVTLLGAASFSFSAHTCVGGTLACEGRLQMGGISLSNCPLLVRRGGLVINNGTYHVRNTANPMQVFQGGRVLVLNVTTSGSIGNTGIGIKVFPGAAFTYLAKPSISGNGGNPDTVIGTTGKLYAAIPFAEYLATSAPAYMTTE